MGPIAGWGPFLIYASGIRLGCAHLSRLCPAQVARIAPLALAQKSLSEWYLCPSPHRGLSAPTLSLRPFRVLVLRRRGCVQSVETKSRWEVRTCSSLAPRSKSSAPSTVSRLASLPTKPRPISRPPVLELAERQSSHCCCCWERVSPFLPPRIGRPGLM
jgi:hypothetical protein